MEIDFYKQALDSSFDGILIADRDGIVVYINMQYENITGLRSEDMLGHRLQELLEQGIISRAISIEVLETGETVSTVHKYSSGRSALSSARPIFNSEHEVVGVINNTRNIDDLLTIQRDLEENKRKQERSSQEIEHLREILDKKTDFVYVSNAMEETLSLARKVAPFDTTVMIYGQSGTGKEVLSRYIHRMSPRAGNIFVKVNCAAIPRELFESELFGYEKGSFTGASPNGKIGLFELANGGTIFLDEIGELQLDVQSKLLRAIQEKEIMRIGGKKRIDLDIRLIAATNKNLKEESDAGRFRADLYFRLSVFPITIAPLRDRRDDVPILIEFFINKLNTKYRTSKVLSQEALHSLERYDFPGNVRELENIVEYLFIISEDTIQIEAIPGKILSQIMISGHGRGIIDEKLDKLPYLVDLYEKTIIEDAIAKCHNLEEASQILGIHYSTLSRKMRKYNLNFR